MREEECNVLSNLKSDEFRCVQPILILSPISVTTGEHGVGVGPPQWDCKKVQVFEAYRVNWGILDPLS